jgi:hypothetical protein
MPLLVAVVLVVGVTTVFTLFVRAKDIPQPDPVSPTRHLEDRKAAIYDNLKDLQFEYRVGKLSDADYQQTKLTLQKELAGVLAEIDRIGSPGVEQKAAPKTPPQVPQPVAGTVCPHCGAKFPAPLKFCGECGKAMA